MLGCSPVLTCSQSHRHLPLFSQPALAPEMLSGQGPRGRGRLLACSPSLCANPSECLRLGPRGARGLTGRQAQAGGRMLWGLSASLLPSRSSLGDGHEEEVRSRALRGEQEFPAGLAGRRDGRPRDGEKGKKQAEDRVELGGQAGRGPGELELQPEVRGAGWLGGGGLGSWRDPSRHEGRITHQQVGWWQRRAGLWVGADAARLHPRSRVCAWGVGIRSEQAEAAGISGYGVVSGPESRARPPERTEEKGCCGHSPGAREGLDPWAWSGGG